MRIPTVLLAVLAGLSASAPSAVLANESSNPAFLGIAMQDTGGQPPGGGPARGPCVVDGTTEGSGAKQAGLRAGDALQTINGTAVANCDAVLKVVQGHLPGDVVTLGIRRARQPMTLTARLISRAEILRRRYGGQSIAPIELFGVDDQKRYDLRDRRGKTTIVGWFDARRCDGCAGVFARVASWARARSKQAALQPLVLAATAGDEGEVGKLKHVTLDVPLTVVEPMRYEELTITDIKRIHFMVIDAQGIVQHVAPVMPNSEDTDAALDELFAAAEQAGRRASR